MRRFPRPWFSIPVLAAGVLGGLLGRNIARVLCTVDPGQADGTRGCVGPETLSAILGAVVAMVGVGVVLVLVVRSLAEWRATRDRMDGDAATSDPDGRDEV